MADTSLPPFVTARTDPQEDDRSFIGGALPYILPRMALAADSGEQGLEFLRSRVASFGLFSGGSLLALWVFRMFLGHDALVFDSIGHLVTALILLSVWPILRGINPSRRGVRVVEVIALTGSSAMIVAVCTTIPKVFERPEHIMVMVLSGVALARAVYVPSSGLMTALLSVLTGVALLAAVYVSYRDSDVSVYFDYYPDQPRVDSATMAARITLTTAGWWALSSALAYATSRVIYGLRKEVTLVRRLGQYHLDRKLGEGGMGIVYEAHHAMLRRPTAVKLLPRDRAGDRAMTRFEREVKLTASLGHPNTVTVYDYGRTPDGIFYYAMELLQGATLEQVVQVGGPQAPARVGHILGCMAGALSEAHELQLIHRDVKPANVMLCRQGGQTDVVKVLDFGLVKEMQPASVASDVTHSDAITGTPHYMSPEAVTKPESVDARSDLYALGAVGYYLLTARHVFAGSSVVEVLSQHLHQTPEAPSMRLG
jgi:eukaryotic-like serine/threonine-protein kinase